MASSEQEKQERTRKKHARTGEEQKITNENKKNNNPITLYEAKRRVFSLLQQGWKYREISQVLFQIEGLGMKRFSISEIAKVKNEFVGGNRNETSSLENPKKDKSEIFRLIKNGTKLDDIVILTDQDPKFVKETFEEYMNLKNFSPSLVEEIMKILNKRGIKINDIEMLLPFITKMVDAYKLLNILQYRCCVCKKPMSLSPSGDNKGYIQDLADAIDFLSKTHGHPEC